MNSIEQQDLYGKSNYEIVAALGSRFRSYRIALRLTQKEVAQQAGVSVLTLARFEHGNASAIGLSHFVGLMRAVGQLEAIAASVPEIPDSLYEKHVISQRVRRRKYEK